MLCDMVARWNVWTQGLHPLKGIADAVWRTLDRSRTPVKRGSSSSRPPGEPASTPPLQLAKQAWATPPWGLRGRVEMDRRVGREVSSATRPPRTYPCELTAG